MAKKKKNNPGKRYRTAYFFTGKIKEMDRSYLRFIFVSPRWRYLALFTTAILTFLFFYYSFFFQDNILETINSFESRIAVFLLNMFGQEASASGSFISGSGGGISVSRGCDGIEPMVMYILAILLTPLSFRKKLPGLVLGFLVLFLLNLFRIAGLYFSAAYFPDAFDFLHIHGGYIIFIGITIAMWLLWLNWALRTEPQVPVAG